MRIEGNRVFLSTGDVAVVRRAQRAGETLDDTINRLGRRGLLLLDSTASQPDWRDRMKYTEEMVGG